MTRFLYLMLMATNLEMHTIGDAHKGSAAAQKQASPGLGFRVKKGMGVRGLRVRGWGV